MGQENQYILARIVKIDDRRFSKIEFCTSQWLDQKNQYFLDNHILSPNDFAKSYLLGSKTNSLKLCKQCINQLNIATFSNNENNAYAIFKLSDVNEPTPVWKGKHWENFYQSSRKQHGLDTFYQSFDVKTILSSLDYRDATFQLAGSSDYNVPNCGIYYLPANRLLTDNSTAKCVVFAFYSPHKVIPNSEVITAWIGSINDISTRSLLDRVINAYELLGINYEQALKVMNEVKNDVRSLSNTTSDKYLDKTTVQGLNEIGRLSRDFSHGKDSPSIL